MFLSCSFKKHYNFGMHVFGAMLQSETPAELGAISHNVAVLCSTAYENKARESFNFLNAVISNQDIDEVLMENVSFS